MTALAPPRRCDAEALRLALVAVQFRDQAALRSIRQLAEVIASPRTTPERRASAHAAQAVFVAEHNANVREEYNLRRSITQCGPLKQPTVMRALGATFPLEAYDGALLNVQQHLVRLGFLGSATGKWDWATYQAMAYATQYIGVPYSQHVHASTNTVDINDDWIAALERAAPAPAGTIGLWSSIPHVSPWPMRLAIAAGVGVLGYGAWRFWKRCRR